MAVINIVKYEGNLDEFIWKFPNEELGTWTQLIVNESQEAILLKDGQICDIFSPGRYTLESQNIPILNKIVNIPFGGESPFKVAVWFINKRANFNIKWGTTSPIQLQDPKYGIFIPIRSFGQFGICINNSKSFFLKIVGVKSSFNKNEINDYFRGLQLTKIKDVISSYVINKKISILEINAHINELSEYTKKEMKEIFQEYGIELINFYINDISVPENDSGVIKLKEALAKKAEMDIVGFNYTQERTFNTLEGAAKNSSSNSSNFIGAGVGMAMGVGLGNNFSDKINTSINYNKNIDNEVEKVKCKKCETLILKGLKFCPECGEAQIKKCPSCGIIIENENAKFCFECGISLKKVCKTCGNSLENDIKFCPECGEKIF